MLTTTPHNFVENYNAGQKKLRADHLDENFSALAAAIDSKQPTLTFSDGLDSTDGVVKVKLGEGLSFDDNKAIMAKISGMAIGSIFPFAGATAPYGSLVCDGSAVSRETYAKLFEAIGTLHGEGDGSTTFNLPNYIGKTFWGGLDVGSVKEAGLPNIDGYFPSPCYGVLGEASGAFFGGPISAATIVGGPYTTSGVSFDASLSNPIYGNSSTVQPPAVVTLPCIKAFDTIAESATIETEQLASDLANLLTKVQILENAKFVVESYYDEATGDWYRVYSDGWIEQGGVYQMTYDNGTQENKDITLKKPYKTVDSYMNYATYGSYAGGTIGAGAVASFRISKSVIRLQKVSIGVPKINWWCCGIGA